MEHHHKESEERRKHRLQELKEDIESKENLIASQQKKLADVERACEQVKTEADTAIRDEVEVFLEKRTAETAVLNEEIRSIVDNERKRDLDSVKVIEEIRQIWAVETEKITSEERDLTKLVHDYNEKSATLERSENISDENKAIFQVKCC